MRSTNTLITLFAGTRYVAICKLVLSHRLGIECGDPRLPALPLTDDQRSVVIDAIQHLDLEPVALVVPDHFKDLLPEKPILHLPPDFSVNIVGDIPRVVHVTNLKVLGASVAMQAFVPIIEKAKGS